MDVWMDPGNPRYPDARRGFPGGATTRGRHGQDEKLNAAFPHRLAEFWEDHFQCRYPNASWTPYNRKYTKPCTTRERLTQQNTAFEDQLQFVSDAVTAFGYAFR